MRKKLLSILALLLFVSMGAWAQGPWTSGDCTVKLSGGVLTVSKTSGTGAMADYAIVIEQPWNGSCASITSIVVGEGVTHIGNRAFQLCSNVTSISLPTTLETIGDYAFYGCSHTALTSITIPDKVTTIGQSAFANCSKLTSVTIPDKVTTIGQSAFAYCSKLTSVTIGNSVETIGNYAFQSCSSLTTVTIPDKVTTIGLSAFQSCSSLTSVTIGNSVETIGIYAFQNCSKLTSVTIPDKVTTIGKCAFRNCSSLTTVTLNSNPTIGTNAFKDIASSAAVTMNLTANAAGGANWMTFYNQNYSFTPDANTKVYKGAVSGGNLVLTEVTDILAGNAVILKSTASPITLTLTTSPTTTSGDFSGNELKGGTTVESGYDAYTLSRGSGGTGTLGFYKFNGASLDGSKAHLEIAQSAGARGFIGFGDDNTTAIEAPAISGIEDGEVYDLTGRRINGQPTKKGIYVRNGQKFIVK